MFKFKAFCLECINCGKKIGPEVNTAKCPVCKGLFMPRYDEEYIKHLLNRNYFTPRQYFDEIRWGAKRKQYPYGSGVFMWLDFILPDFPTEFVVSLREGQTDMFEAPDWLKKEIGLKNLFIKLEGQNPSGSFKDRGMSMAISWARFQQEVFPELGIVGVACASTGDTSASAAQYASYCRDKLLCVIFVPHGKISPEQLAQATMSGAMVIAVDHSTNPGFDSCMKIVQEFNARFPKFAMVNSANILRVVGQQSIAVEINQDFGWDSPDWIAIPAGNGGNLTALMLSLLRQKEHGLIDRVPGVIAGQTTNSDPLVRWADSGFTKYEPLKKPPISIASAMDIQDPVSFPRINLLLKDFLKESVSGIHFFKSDNLEINRTRARFNRAGADVCPQGAVAIHATLQARDKGIVKENDRVVAISTASSLKFTESAMKYHMSPCVASGEVTEAFANPFRVATTGTVEEIAKILNLT